MKAVYFERFAGPITVETVADPVPTMSGVVIEVKATGICRSDWHGWMGHDPDVTLPHVPGHELAGVVAAVGKEVRHWHVGDRVTVPFVGGCGHCPQCMSGNHQVCDAQFQPGFTHWGSFAELVAVDYADVNVVRLPDELDFVAAASLGCRFITSFRAVVAQGGVTAGQWVAVHGCGGVGLSAIMIATALGARVVAVDIMAEKLALAQALGAVAVVNGNTAVDVVAAVKAITQGGAHVSIDALGHPVTCFNSIANLRKRGKHIQVGLMVAEHKHATVPMDLVIAHELEILGSHGMQAYNYAPLLGMIQDGKLQPKKLIGKHVTLAEAPTILQGLNDFGEMGITVIDNFDIN